MKKFHNIKMWKRGIPLCIAMLMSFTYAGAYPVMAAPGELGVSIGNASGVPGDEVTVTVSLTQNPGIAGLALAIIYDSSVLSVKDPVTSSLSGPSFVVNTSTLNEVLLAWAGASDITQIGDIAQITFQIADNAAPGDYQIILDNNANTDAYNANMDTVSITPNLGKVTVAGTPVSTINASALVSFGNQPEGYTQPTAQTVTVTNAGNGSVTLTQPAAVNYEIGALSTDTLTANGATATFTVQPKAGLPAGDYNETISINGGNGASATVNASFTVTATPTYSLSASALTTFGSLEEGYTQPAVQTVTITNTGNVGIIISKPSSVNYEIGALSNISLDPNGGTSTFTVQPKAGLSAGSYNETIGISGSDGASTSVNATFKVTVSPSGASPLVRLRQLYQAKLLVVKMGDPTKYPSGSWDSFLNTMDQAKAMMTDVLGTTDDDAIGMITKLTPLPAQ